MSKEEILAQIQELTARGELNRDEVLMAMGETQSQGVGLMPGKKEHHIDIAKILYGIGGLIVVAGIIFLIAQMWESFGAAEQILTTLGSALVIYIAAVLLYQYDRFKLPALVLFVIAAAIMPLGIFVTLHNLSPGGNVWLGQLIMAGIPAVVYALTSRLYRQSLLLLVAILFTTWAFYAVVGWLLESSYLSGETQGKIWAYVTLLVGAIYLLLGKTMPEWQANRLLAVFNLLGSGAVLGAGFALTFFQEFWMLVYFVLILAAIYLSTAWRSRVMLILGAAALMGHLSHISFEYFANSLGWPLALIISGFLMIGIGYGTVILNQRYIRSVK